MGRSPASRRPRDPRPQPAQLLLEVAHPLEQRDRERESLGVEFEVAPQAKSAARDDEAVRAESPVARTASSSRASESVGAIAPQSTRARSSASDSPESSHSSARLR